MPGHETSALSLEEVLPVTDWGQTGGSLEERKLRQGEGGYGSGGYGEPRTATGWGVKGVGVRRLESSGLALCRSF